MCPTNRSEYAFLPTQAKWIFVVGFWSSFIGIYFIPRSFFFFLCFMIFKSSAFCLYIRRGVLFDSLNICYPCCRSAFMRSFPLIHGFGWNMGLWPRPQIFSEIFKIEKNLSFILKMNIIAKKFKEEKEILRYKWCVRLQNLIIINHIISYHNKIHQS